ncbi:MULTISPECIES: YopT-type cysteine protease domain-containing protein [unclassified Pseudomonas]|uniref:YopT-type cysteine protease domain-containing protein n=1 Tax=unclassified Pseudomonas TaxID=196821 RepID=UPI000A1F6513|nr:MULTISPECIES: YopT-type cysteine protease domain-containing protein [unclassified Pseudomonas]
MSYEAICKKIEGHGEGVHNFGQSSFLLLVAENRAGICRGLSTAWLIARKKGKDYLKEIVEPTETTGLLHEKKTANEASDFQSAYVDISGDTPESPSQATLDALVTGGVGKLGEKKAEAYQGFATAGEAIASFVLTSSCRYFILSIKGTLGGHSVAFHRPWVFFGKGSSCVFFDPNFGEFKLEGTKGITLCLDAVAAAYSQGLSTGYRIWGFG